MIGQHIRAYRTDYCRKAPDDLYLSDYYEGVIVRSKEFMPGIEHVFYRITSVVIDNKPVPQSWRIGTEADFFSNSRHFVATITNQLQLPV